METRNLICIGCPLGCNIEVSLEQGSIILVKGNTCQKGDEYARSEVIAPKRIVTSTVKVKNSMGNAVVVPCKTKTGVPKNKIFDVINELRDIVITAPVKIGDVIKSNVADTAVDVIATKNIV